MVCSPGGLTALNGASPWRLPARTLIELDRVVKAYGSGVAIVRALDDVTLTIAGSQFVVVLGPSGSGKTTLLNIIGALDTPTSGRVIVAGRELAGASRRDLAAIRRSTVSFIFRSFNLFPGLTALENVQFGIDATGRTERDSAVRILESVGLGERVNQFPHQLSGAASPPNCNSSYATWRVTSGAQPSSPAPSTARRRASTSPSLPRKTSMQASETK